MIVAVPSFSFTVCTVLASTLSVHVWTLRLIIIGGGPVAEGHSVNWRIFFRLPLVNQLLGVCRKYKQAVGSNKKQSSQSRIEACYYCLSSFFLTKCQSSFYCCGSCCNFKLFSCHCFCLKKSTNKTFQNERHTLWSASEMPSAWRRYIHVKKKWKNMTETSKRTAK